MRYAFLAIVSFFFLTPATAVAQNIQPPPQVVVPQCPQDADCHFHGEGHVFEQYSSGGGQYPQPWYGGGGQGYYGGRAQNNLNFTFVFGGGQGRGGGGQGQLICGRNRGDQLLPNGQCYHQGGRILSVSCPAGLAPVERSPGDWVCVRP